MLTPSSDAATLRRLDDAMEKCESAGDAARDGSAGVAGRVATGPASELLPGVAVPLRAGLL